MREATKVRLNFFSLKDVVLHNMYYRNLECGSALIESFFELPKKKENFL